MTTMKHASPFSNGYEAEVFESLKKIALEEMNLTSAQIEAINVDAPLVERMELDSLRQVVLMASIERDYGCTFDIEDLQNIETIRDLIRLIVARTPRDRRGEAE